MPFPDWRASTAGSRIRVALWLASEIGEGGVFTKSQLREAFPNVEQVDRRMRDLRPEGWKIATYREDRSLEVDELRLVAIGGHVWERGYQSRASIRLTDQQRQAVLAKDGYACIHCGIAGGEPYPDDPVRTAKLTVSRTADARGDTDVAHTVCDRCRAGATKPEKFDDVLAQLNDLNSSQLRKLRQWIDRGSRDSDPVAVAWTRYLRLPDESRQEVRKRLDSG